MSVGFVVFYFGCLVPATLLFGWPFAGESFLYIWVLLECAPILAWASDMAVNYCCGKGGEGVRATFCKRVHTDRQRIIQTA
jgi:hypothetical protein